MIHADQFDNKLFFVIVALASIGSIDVFSEILDQSIHIFAENWVKKVVLFVSVYQTTKSIRLASIISIFVMLVFKDIFFNEKTTIRKPKARTILSA